MFKNGDKLNIKKLDDCLFKLYFLLPTDNSEVYNLFDNFLSSCTILFISKKPKKSINEIREAFDILWDLITTSMFLKNARKFVSPEDISLFELIRSFHLNSKMCTAEERVSNLESIASSINPDELDVPMDKDSIEIRRILAEGAEEE